MQLRLNPRTSNSFTTKKIVIKTILFVSILFLAIFLLDKVELNVPSKLIKQEISNDKLKTLK